MTLQWLTYFSPDENQKDGMGYLYTTKLKGIK